jgi:choline transport protein
MSEALEEGMPPQLFGTWSLSAFAVVLSGVWASAAASLTIGIFGGGPAIEIWSALAVGLALSIGVASLAEFASAYPSEAGCTHVATQLAGPKWGRLAVSLRLTSVGPMLMFE